MHSAVPEEQGIAEDPAPPRRSPRRSPQTASVVDEESDNWNSSARTQPYAAASCTIQHSRATVQLNLFGRALGKRKATVHIESEQEEVTTGCGTTVAQRPQAPAAAGAAYTKNPQHGADMPDLAAVERERSIRQKPPVGFRGRQHASRKTVQTEVSVMQRLAEFPEQSLKQSAGQQIFFQACKEILRNLKQTLKVHISSAKHQRKLHEWLQQCKDDTALREDIKKYFEAHKDEHMASLDPDIHVFRLRTGQASLRSGTPLERVSFFRPLLERAGKPLTSSSHLQSYIPKIELLEFEAVKTELQKANFISLAFDGTTRLGEAVCITARWCGPSFQRVEMRLVCFITSKLHLKSNQLASLFTKVVCQQLAIDPEHVISISRDSASVNGAASRILTASPFTSCLPILCVSHTLNNAGARIEFDIFNEFTTSWLELVGGRSPHAGAKSLWKDAVAPQQVPGFSNVRWWSKAEIQFLLAENFDKLPEFLAKLDELDYGDATRKKLSGIIRDDSKRHALQLALASMLDMRILVETTYWLEGDRLEILILYERIEVLRKLGDSLRANNDGILPNLDAVLRATTTLTRGACFKKVFPTHGLCDGVVLSREDNFNSTIHPGRQVSLYRVKYTIDGEVEHLEDEELRPLLTVKELPERQEIAKKLSAAFDYLEDRLAGRCDAHFSCELMYKVCKTLRAFNPAFARAHLVPSSVDDLAIVPAITEHISLAKLKVELPEYLTAAAVAPAEASKSDSVADFTDAVLAFWASTSARRMPEWRQAARMIFSMSPNSASCERVFSLTKVLFGCRQLSSFADRLQAALMLRYNDQHRLLST